MMKNYLFTLLFVSALTGGLVYLSTGSFYEKYLRYLATLLSLLALLSPLPSLFSSFDTEDFLKVTISDQISSNYGELLKEKTENRLNEELTHQIKQNCNLNDEDFAIVFHLSLNEEESLLNLEGVTVYLYSLLSITKREQIKEELLPICKTITFIEQIN